MGDVEGLGFMRGFARLCDDGWRQGWHEFNGGNLTYRLTDAEAAACVPFLRTEPGDWTPLGFRADGLGGAFFAVTGAGCHLRNVPLELARNAGIVQLDDAGGAYRAVWGFEGGGRPTSELASHVMAHAVRARATSGACRVLYHAHPENVIALTKVVPPDARSVTRALWKAMTECVMVFPQGVGVVGCMVPGGVEIARETARLMESHGAVVWAHHGLFASGADFDAAFGLMHAIEKAAGIHNLALMMNGGSPDFPNAIPDGVLRDIAAGLGLEANGAFLD